MSDWRTENGYLLAENPVRGFEIPVEKNPRRPVATQARYEAIRAISDDVLVRVSRGDDVETVRSDLSELLDLANGTGRRLSAICALRSIAFSPSAPAPGRRDRLCRARASRRSVAAPPPPDHLSSVEILS